MRRASIDKINARYRGTSNVSPAAHGVRTSVIRGSSPIAPVVGVSHVAPAVIGAGPSYIAAPTSVIAGRGAVVGRGASVIGGPVYGSGLGSAISREIVHTGAVGLRRSTVVTPPVYEVVEHAPVYEAVTTPGKVYEIVTPIVDVTPDTVIQTDVVTVITK